MREFSDDKEVSTVTFSEFCTRSGDFSPVMRSLRAGKDRLDKDAL